MAVARKSAIAQVIKQFDNGEGLLRRPVGRDFEGNGERHRVRDFARDVIRRAILTGARGGNFERRLTLMTWLCRRWRARRSARS